MHCKDWAKDKGYAVAFGEGDAPWKEIFAAAEAGGGVEYYLIEQEIAGPDGEFAMAQRCLGQLQEAARLTRARQNALFTTPPSTRRAAPVVADASGLAR